MHGITSFASFAPAIVPERDGGHSPVLTQANLLRTYLRWVERELRVYRIWDVQEPNAIVPNDVV